MTKKTILAVAASGILLTGLSAFMLASDIPAFAMGFGRNRNQTLQTTTSSSTANTQTHYQDLSALPKEDLSNDEKESLLYMREEEKLARDVYLTLGEKYDLSVFNNIAKAEQKHMDTIKLLLDKYGLNDSVTSNETGKFNNETLAKLYTDLVNKGSVSELEALKVGATIEDLDISDLNSDLAKTDNQDIKQVFESLKKGSENHIRSFVRNIQNQGGSYTPQYISQTDYDTILASSNGQGQGGKGQSEQGQNQGGQGRGRMGK
jgi:hypothetical protein